MREPRNAGFTLVEAVISLLLISLALLLAATLLLEAQRSFLALRQQDGEVRSALAAALLRSDVAAAERVDRRRIGSSSSVLSLRFGDGHRVIYRVADGALVRSVESVDGAAESKSLLVGVVLWSWRPVTPQLLEIAVTTSGSERQSGTERVLRIWRRNRSRVGW